MQALVVAIAAPGGGENDLLPPCRGYPSPHTNTYISPGRVITGAS